MNMKKKSTKNNKNKVIVTNKSMNRKIKWESYNRNKMNLRVLKKWGKNFKDKMEINQSIFNLLTNLRKLTL